MSVKPIYSALLLALLATSILQGCDSSPNLSEQEYIQRAKNFEDKGDLKASVIELKNALQKNPDNPQARLLLGEIYLKSGRGAEAEKELSKAAKLGVSQEIILPRLGEALLLMGDYQRVLDEIRPGEQTSKPNLARIYQMRGDALLNTGKLTEACELFQQSLDTDASNPPTYWGLAQCAVANKNIGEAMQRLQAALNLKDKQATTWILIGDLEQLNNNRQAALAAYTNALKTEPDNLAALQSRLAIKIAQGQLETAKVDVDAIKRIAPKSLYAAYSHALLAFKQQKYPEARDALQEAFQISPDHLPSLLLSGAVNYALGSYELAASQLGKTLKQVPNNAYTRKLLAGTQARLGQYPQALATLQPLHPEQSEDPQLLALAGDIYLRARKYTQANQLLEKAASIDPKSAAIRTGLGVSRLASGDSARALADLESAAALETSPGNNQANTLLILTLLRDKQFDRALQAIAVLDRKQPNNPLTYNFRGGAYLGKKDLVNARRSFEQALAIQPDFFPATANLAQLDLQANNFAAARNRFERVLNTDKNNLQAMLALAEIASITRQQKDYVGWLEKAIKAHPQAVRPQAALAFHYLAQKTPQKALAVANQAVGANPGNPEALNLLGAVQSAANNKVGAIATFTKLTEKAGQSPEAHLNLAMVQMENKQFASARIQLQKALELKPDHLPSLDGMLRLDLAENKPEAALQIARQIQSLYPESPIGFDREGDIQATRKNYPAATIAYKKALDKGIGSTGFIKLHRVYLLAGNTAPAGQLLNDWLKQHPNDNAVRTYAAEYFIFRGQNKQALVQYQELARQAPANVAILNNLATLYQGEKDSRALATAEQAFKLAPDNPAVQDTLGWILVDHGQFPRAVDLLRKALAKAPQSHSTRYHYAVALLRSGDKAQARNELEKLLTGAPKFPEADTAKNLLNSI